MGVAEENTGHKERFQYPYISEELIMSVKDSDPQGNYYPRKITFRTESGKGHFNNLVEAGTPAPKLLHQYNWITACEDEILDGNPGGRFSQHRRTRKIMHPITWEKEPWLQELYIEIKGEVFVHDKIEKLKEYRQKQKRWEVEQQERDEAWLKLAEEFAKEGE
tara:strand:+ start:734 stop:1222 length:489 start_codon:yes stop_codon:yes gene_type:complete